MIKLLRSNLLRLIKNKVFYAALALQAGLMLIMTLNYYLTGLIPDAEVSADMVFSFTACSPFAAILLAAVCSLFIGSDYHNGTIRNKLVIGFPRYQIYFANLITSMLIAVSLNIASMAIFYPVTVPLLGGFTGSAGTLVKIFLIGNLAMLVYASLYTAVAMTSKSTVASLIITVGSLLFMLMVAQYLLSEINAPLTYTELIQNEAGEFIRTEVPNMHRKSEQVLSFFSVLLNIFPSGQSAVLSSNILGAWQAAVSGIAVIGLSVGAGITVFSKVNIK